MPKVTFKKDGVDVVKMPITELSFQDGIWETDEMPSMNVDRLTVNVKYENLVPDGSDVNVDYRIQAKIMGEDDGDEFEPLCAQFAPTFRSENAPTRRLIVTPRPTAYEPNTPHIIADSLGNELIEISVEDSVVPEKVKVRLTLADVDQGNPGLLSLNLTIRGRMD